jgi:hypothetical protein
MTMRSTSKHNRGEASNGQKNVDGGVRTGALLLASPKGFLIRIPNKEARLRAVMALGNVREAHCGFTDFRFLVTNDHIKMLKKERIPFELVS